MKSQTWSPTARYTAFVLVLLFILFVGWEIREMLRPMLMGGIIAYVLYPFISLLHHRLRLSRRLASNIVFFTSLALLILVPVLLVPILSYQTKEITLDLEITLAQMQQYLSVPLHVGGISLDLGTLIPQLRATLAAPLASTPENTLQFIRNTSRNTLWGVIILVSTYLFMTEWENIRGGLVRLAPREYQLDVRKLYHAIKHVWIAYLRGQLTLMIIVGVTFTIVWTIIGVPGSLYLGLLAGVFSVIPDVGPLAATILALAVALLEGSTWLPINNFLFGLLVVGLFVLLINIKNIWLQPHILGRSVHMHSGIVFLAIVGALIFTGIAGAFIIVPVLASLGVIGKYLHARILGLPPFQGEDSTQGRPKPGSDDPVEPESKPAPEGAKKKASR
jgi:predicted PurR-regulated permease PerM